MRDFFTQRAALVVGVIVLLAFVLIATTIGRASYESANRRHDICTEVEKVKTILRDEHTTSLQRSQAFLRKHPNGISGISRKLILQGIHDQQTLLARLKPQRCSD